MLLTSVDQPTRSFFWTAATSETSEMVTEDPLGLDYVAQQVGLLLLPTLTTRSTRAQAYAMVLYGLDLARRAVDTYDLPNTDAVRRELFERWERFWALATLEYREGAMPRGDWDAMRGIRGAKAAWRRGEGALAIDFPLISRQQELGHLGAYLAPLRRSGLVHDGTVSPTPAADEILVNFWDEAAENRHATRYDAFAIEALNPDARGIERKFNNLTLARVGENSRLTSLVQLKRTAQQARLYAALFQLPRDTTTLPVARLVESAGQANIVAPREVINAALAGTLGAISNELRDLLVLARAFGDCMALLLSTFDAVYAAIDQGGWVAARVDVVATVLRPDTIASLKLACESLLQTPRVDDIRRFPMHGAAMLRLVEALLTATPDQTLEHLLHYHSVVQRDRRRGTGWIHEEAGKLTLLVTSYTARPDTLRFPPFKLDAVRTLLIDTGRIPLDSAGTAPEVGA